MDSRDKFPIALGTWQLTREISTGERFNGSVELSWLDNTSMRFEETGQLELADGTQIEGHRNWIWRFKSSGKLEIYYDETPPRLYHSILLKSEDECLKGSAEHHCANDLYHGQYEISRSQIKTIQTVTGPSKDYQIVSHYSK